MPFSKISGIFQVPCNIFEPARLSANITLVPARGGKYVPGFRPGFTEFSPRTSPAQTSDPCMHDHCISVAKNGTTFETGLLKIDHTISTCFHQEYEFSTQSDKHNRNGLTFKKKSQKIQYCPVIDATVNVQCVYHCLTDQPIIHIFVEKMHLPFGF